MGLHSELLSPNCTLFGENIGQLSLLNKFVIDFRYVAQFPNEGDSNVTGVENRGQISNFLPPIKIRRQIEELSEFHFQLELKTQPGSLLGELDDYMSGK